MCDEQHASAITVQIEKANKCPWHGAWEVILAFLSLPPICPQFSGFLLAAMNIRGHRDAPHPHSAGDVKQGRDRPLQARCAHPNSGLRFLSFTDVPMGTHRPLCRFPSPLRSQISPSIGVFQAGLVIFFTLM